MPNDLVLLVADKNIEHSIAGLLTRPAALGIRVVEGRTFVHPRRAPGCLREAQDFLRPFHGNYAHGLVVFDRCGCGREHLSAEALATDVEQRLSVNGWDQRAKVVVLDPELEVWAFADPPRVASCLGWRRNDGDLRRWLERRGLWNRHEAKPRDPREAFERVLYHVQRPRSSATYRRLAETVDFRGCTDPAFAKFRAVLAGWFAAGAAP